MEDEEREIGVESLVTNNSTTRRRGNFRGDTSYFFPFYRGRNSGFCNSRMREEKEREREEQETGCG